MKRIHHFLCCGLLAFSGILAAAQGFDDLKRSKPAQLNPKLQAAVDNNDARALARLLKSQPNAKGDGSRVGKNEKGAPNVIPLFYDVVDRALCGEVSVELCKVALDGGCDPYSVYNGKTPVYRVMDYLSRTPSDRAGNGIEVLNLLLSKKGFDINRRYRSLPPPISYLLSENFRFLGGRYDPDYLSTDLFKTLFAHGANLNTYDENGASLLLLATSTNNEYLQNYLLDNGVNIEKTADSSGNNAVYAAIKRNDVEMLKKILSNYRLKLSTADVLDYTGGTSQDMYNYLASECAGNAFSYEEIDAFRKHFSTKRGLVQDRYESLARSETSAASDFESINLVIQRYPDLGSITEAKRRSIYRNDAAVVDAAYKAALSASKSGKLTSIGHLPTLNDFIRNYGGSRYDPENMLPKARRASEFQSVCEGLTMTVASEYHDEEGFLAASLLERPYYFDIKRAQRDTATIGRAIRVANSGRFDDQCIFQSFYQDNIETLYSKETQLYANINRSIEFVNNESAKARSRHAASGSWSSSSSNRSEDRNDREERRSEEREESRPKSKEQYSCEVEIYFNDGGKLAVKYIEAQVHRDGLFDNNGGYVKAWVDDDGKGVITWDKEWGDYIMKISFTKNIILVESYVLPDLHLEPGKSYKLNADALREE